MKKKLIICFVFFNVINLTYSQTYDLIQEVFREYKPDTIFLNQTFLKDYSIEIESFDEYNIKEWWSPLPHPKTPSVENFLNNFDLKLLRDNMKSNLSDIRINFNKLDTRFFAVSDEFRNKYTKNTYFSFSKAIQNNSKDWSIIFVFSTNRSYDIGGGYMHIYRKIKDKWLLYHKLAVWIW